MQSTKEDDERSKREDIVQCYKTLHEKIFSDEDIYEPYCAMMRCSEHGGNVVREVQ